MFRNRCSSDDPDHHRAIQGQRDVHPNGREMMTMSARASHSCVEQSEGNQTGSRALSSVAPHDPKIRKNEKPIRQKPHLTTSSRYEPQTRSPAKRRNTERLSLRATTRAARYIKHVLHTLGHSLMSCRELQRTLPDFICEANFCFVLLGLELKAEKASRACARGGRAALDGEAQQTSQDERPCERKILVLSEQGRFGGPCDSVDASRCE